ncbi:ATP-dependent RecD-like DNA helicase [Brevibacillus humidisoli]|uniref:SF1B family DNA helicase RecD2 n=1 Tax=Brevibacillus humidisoli TaxID=2895522 RepID=UPI001E55F3BD|nr:ATP-dependent RecD-like DNA helicase [Brevibacillus humidisoli]UFJ38984.1 ATP-dependent RecD-like DNA helicase [Brevibacillus humidisoli]
MSQQTLSLFVEPFIRGQVVREIYFNEENWYGVYRFQVEETNESISEKEVVVVGHFPRPHPDEVYTFYGEWKVHPRFGSQYSVNRYERETPKTAAGVEKYLASGLFEGIGKKTAKRIVAHLGVDALSVIADNPEQLEQVPGISRERARKIYDSVLEHRMLERTMVFLYDFGIGVHLALRIYQTYKSETMDILQTSPYKLVEDIDGIGFKRADEIARAVGVAASSPERVKAAVLYTLKEAAYGEGHVYLPVAELADRSRRLLAECGGHSFQDDELTLAIQHMFEEQKLIWDDDRAYLSTLFFAEIGLAKQLRYFAKRAFQEAFPASEYYRALGKVEEELGITYAASQREAVEQALQSGLMLLTGGPGTGKTTVIRAICCVFAELNGLSLDPKQYDPYENPFPILLVAPTGRAAKRMTETTGLPAMTIHRLLGWNGDSFEYDQERQVHGRLLIIDEMSMVDIWLANQLFRALPDDIQIVMVGDPDQLPSVGPGHVLQDMIDSGLIPQVHLHDIYRQAEQSSIIRLAHDIREGKVPEDLLSPAPDRRFFTSSPQDLVRIVKQICEGAVKKGYTPKEIQVLSPMYKGNAGVNQLNQELQDLFNPKTEQKREVSYGETVFRTGDKVLQLVNNAEEQVYNGDIGEIVAIFRPNENEQQEELLVVLFDGKEVAYKRSQYHQLTLAYCCSVHKSQGSEFPIVIMPFVRQYYRMLRRKLVYTGVTRSKSYLLLCGDPEAFRLAVENDDESVRHTYLRQRLVGQETD